MRGLGVATLGPRCFFVFGNGVVEALWEQWQPAFGMLKCQKNEKWKTIEKMEEIVKSKG